MLELFILLPWDFTGTNLFFQRDNFLRMDVYFSALKYESVEQIPDYDLPAFLSKNK